MRGFNTRGMNTAVREFKLRKLSSRPTKGIDCETNHTLDKCGLIETSAKQPNADEFTVTILKRNLTKQCVSHINRSDFCNGLKWWQWYLAPSYPNNMVSSKPLIPMGANGLAIWYTLEMNSRQRYYERTNGDDQLVANIAKRLANSDYDPDQFRTAIQPLLLDLPLNLPPSCPLGI